MKILTLTLITCMIASYSRAQVAAPGTTNTWIQKADFGGIARSYAAGFSISGKAYIGTGLNGDATNFDLKDFWEYDPATDKWTQKADFGGEARDAASAFSVNGKGYIGMGKSGEYPFIYYKDLWEYDPATDKWTKKADYPGIAKAYTTGFSIISKGYIGGGYRYDTGPYSDFWEYDPAADKWTKKADFGGGGRSNPFGFSISDKGYMGLGWNGGWYNDFYEYNPSKDKWTKKANFGGSSREYTTGFSIGNKGYIGTGYPSALKDFWEYNPVTNVWIRKADFGGLARSGAVGFSIGNKGYIGTGNNSSTLYKDLWEYTPVSCCCEVPSDLIVTKVTDTSATLRWVQPAAPASSFKIRYREVGSSVFTKQNVKGSSNHIVICGLMPNTTYEWQIRSNCTVDTSGWVCGPNFTTGSTFATVISADASLIKTNEIKALVSPNPNKGNFTIQMQLPAKAASTALILYNNFGEMVWQQNAGMLSGSVSSLITLENKLSAGVYVLVIERNDIRLMQKIVVSK